jgi:thymidylate synthase (methanogen type)
MAKRRPQPRKESDNIRPPTRDIQAVTHDSVAVAWERSIDLLLSNGRWVSTQRGFRALELYNLRMLIRKPSSREDLPSLYAFGKSFVSEYEHTHEAGFATAAIKDRLFAFGHGAVNQIESVVRILRADRWSRRAFVSTIDPSSDAASPHPPCLTYLQFTTRDDHLDLFAVFRSNDAWLAALPDILSMIRLQETVADALEIPVGSYAHTAVSYHLYETDYPPALAAFRRVNR